MSFPFQWPSDDPQISSTPNNQQIDYDAAADPLREMVTPFKITAASKTEEMILRGPEEDEDSRKKKKKHREAERQRRMEMASLFGDLRSLLPLEFIRGKRSMPDQMNEAVNYIRHLEAEIKELEAKRDKMKMIRTCSSASNSSSSVVIIPSRDGILQLLINRSSKLMEGSVCRPLSEVMKLLSQEGVNVFNYFTCRVDDRTIYKIQCEVNIIDAASTDLNNLQHKLEELLAD